MSSPSDTHNDKRLAEEKRVTARSGAYLMCDWSKEQPTHFSMEACPTRPRSPEPSCVSMNSDASKEQPLSFQMEESFTWSRSPEPSCVSINSNIFMDQPVSFQKEASVIWLSDECGRADEFTEKHLFKEVEHKIIALIKEELTIFKKLLSPSYPACSEKEVKDEDKQNSVKEAILQITLHVLRSMKLNDLANTLQNKMLPMCQKKLKCSLKRKFQCISEGISKHGNSKLLTEIFTELYITEGDSGEINNEHEVRQIETKALRPGNEDIPIKCSDLFKSSPGPNKYVRTVLTKGVAGIGKTVSVQKFIVDWAEGNANEDIQFIFPLPFRELNLLKEEKLSLMDLLHHFFPETSDLHEYEAYKVLFIFDGLDETRLPLDFQNNVILRDVTEPASVDVLLTNLMKGNLLPSALLWITSRPAAAHQIPPDCVDQVTEVRGFSDAQKQEYFKKRIHDHRLANRIIKHLRSTRSLYIMCHIPVFCWITATVLERMLTEAESKEIPKTLTQMFIYFLIFQTQHRDQKYNPEMGFHQTRDRIVALGNLAYQQLKKRNLIFYEDDLQDCGIDVREVSVYSGMCTEIFREEFGLYLGKIYCFVHLSIQEFLAALFVFVTIISNSADCSEDAKNSAMTRRLKKSVDKALHSRNGHLDLFLRFLLGLSLNSNQALLRSLITPLESSHSKQDVVMYIKEKIRENPAPEKSINLFHCLNELNDQSLVEEVQMYMKRKDLKCLSGVRFSPAQWSALVFVLLNSEEKLDEFNLSKYDRSEQCCLRLLPVIQASRKAVLCWGQLTLTSCKELASALSSTSSNLRELDLSNNKLYDAGVKLLSKGLMNPHCKLESLRLCSCNITENSCGLLATMFNSNCSSLRKLNLSNNTLKDSGIKMLSGALDNPKCKLESLKLSCCNLTEQSCEFLASAFSLNYSSLRELNLSNNILRDSGVKMLFSVYEITDFTLEVLKLRACHLTEKSCSALACILTSDSSRIQVLDLSNNNLQDSVVEMISAAEMNPHCKLVKLRLRGCRLTEKSCSALAILLRSKLTELDLGNNHLHDSGVKLLSEGLKNSRCKLELLKLRDCGITEVGCAALSTAVSSNPSHLRELDLSSNKIRDLGVQLLSDPLRNVQCILKKLGLFNCSITDKSCAALVSALMSNPSHLREMNLGGNDLTESGLNVLFALVHDPVCALEKLDVGIRHM